MYYLHLLRTIATYIRYLPSRSCKCTTYMSYFFFRSEQCKTAPILQSLPGAASKVFSRKNRSRSSRERAAPNLVANRRIFAEFCNILAEISPTINRFHQRLTDFPNDLQICTSRTDPRRLDSKKIQ